MVKEAAPILRRQKQDYEASFEVIAKLTSELNEARKVKIFFYKYSFTFLFFFKELSELHQLSGESIENYRYIQRENQFLINDNKSLATKVSFYLLIDLLNPKIIFRFKFFFLKSKNYVQVNVQ
jgi:hypothetical protein